MFFTLLNSAMCLNSWCTFEAMFRFLTFPPFCYVKIRKKDYFTSILNAWFYFVFAKKFNILVRKYVYCMYQVSNISKLLTLISFRTDNFGGKIGSFIIFKILISFRTDNFGGKIGSFIIFKILISFRTDNFGGKI